ncbi:MAG: hypothetical protein WCS01_11180 [bacterium]
MELRPFIAKALSDIIGGIQDAQKETPENTVVPDIVRNFKAVEAGISQLQTVTFEVTVRADDAKGSEAKLNVVAAVFGGGVSGHSGESVGHAATLKFAIPLCLPVHAQKNKAK